MKKILVIVSRFSIISFNILCGERICSGKLNSLWGECENSSQVRTVYHLLYVEIHDVSYQKYN